ncbi:MAG: hypothetical protein QOE36_3197, partial [Gaiellaceae bacterium]|nr:hypothetical protein [Gaiellaceae bacterium]
MLAAVVLGLVAAAQGLAYLPFVSPHTTMDSPLYLQTADGILHGRYSVPLPAVDETYWTVPPAARGVLQRETTRTPGYPLLLAAVGGGERGASRDLLYLVQALLCGLGVVLVGLTARRLWGPRIGLLACALYALDPCSKRDVSLVLTEALAGVLVVAAAYAFVRAAQSRELRWWAATGALIAGAALTRPV